MAGENVIDKRAVPARMARVPNYVRLRTSASERRA